ncbi:tRNA N6-adenosine threonylcarbamoyltransferase, mitochondrial [Ammospiza nelsoni]|uniref:tRNA N6-adenosine threonylcarbamoyltransferase, mitochondrial n=1 Tax=Ammospiza caudacuta TaxID=2857398 RepID=UPI002738D8AC|nr:tRNA N6-adenosine threonylcarbamoyltransferase, mitochondrial [Ammospiza caudacuta]XP_058665273.1 tRNA N6-adenosine threonylcarbamoyltransferase, mitochondrial [Ammospiza caudacuta]XP_059332032.1 tRNA N6-adenosine threonylcarbamoyltransferase, mitochondrial [Ammospiza nelsoni]XP_059332033.1 tRNA N6-adenosine threonylcarbamoyltransferase, mitochondrial [Ammospiza nelsoni]XP_059332034.1 tRNA N6-adenosine threonylcarbamoyltransferase, mitochondrial [Ammospiza nelsoni]
MSSIAKSVLRSVKHGRAAWLRTSSAHSGKRRFHRLVLGIETSCDDTGAAVVDEAGCVLGEALHCQKEVHLQSGGIIPVVAQQLHRENIDRVVQEALSASGVSVAELAAVATTVKPGLALSLGVGLHYSRGLVSRHQKPFIPIHHMEAHALTIRLTHPLEFPFLVLLISGGHCLLAVAQGVSDFLLLGQSIDIAPGDMLDKVARRLSLSKHPECHSMAGGQAIEHLAQSGNQERLTFRLPMRQYRNCDFSFSGLQNIVYNAIVQKEKEEGIQEGEILSCVKDVAAAVQHAVAVHIIQRTYRAMIFCIKNSILPSKNATLVVSGGVASNQYIRKVLQNLADANDFALLCPPPRLCTDNGVMIAWNGIERLRAGLGVLHSTAGVRYEPRAPLGIDISKRVEEDSIKVPKLKEIRWLAS